MSETENENQVEETTQTTDEAPAAESDGLGGFLGCQPKHGKRPPAGAAFVETGDRRLESGPRKNERRGKCVGSHLCQLVRSR